MLERHLHGQAKGSGFSSSLSLRYMSCCKAASQTLCHTEPWRPESAARWAPVPGPHLIPQREPLSLPCSLSTLLIPKFPDPSQRGKTIRPVTLRALLTQTAQVLTTAHQLPVQSQVPKFCGLCPVGKQSALSLPPTLGDADVPIPSGPSPSLAVGIPSPTHLAHLNDQRSAHTWNGMGG